MLAKNKLKSTNKKFSKKDNAKSDKENFTEKIENLSWDMGKKTLKKRDDLYDR